MRTHRFLVGYLTGVASQIAIVCLGIWATPKILFWLGEESFGAVRVVGDWLSYLLIIDFGVGGALLPLMVRSISANKAQLQRTLIVGLKACSRISGIMLVMGMIGLLFVQTLVPVSSHLQTDLQWGFFFGVLSYFTYCFHPFRAVVEAKQKSYLIHSLLAIQSFLIIGLSLWFAKNNLGIKGQFFAAFLGALPFPICLILLVLREDGNIFKKLSPIKADKEISQSLWKLNRPTFLFDVCGRMKYCSDNIIAGLLLGPVYVVPLFLTQRLMTLARNQLQGIGNAGWAALAELHATKKRQLFQDRLIDLTHLVTVIGTGVLVPFIAYNGCFVRLWIGSRYYGGDTLTLVAGASALFHSILSLWLWTFTGTGLIHKLQRVLIISTACNLIASVVLTLWLGIIGPVLGSLLTFLIIELPMVSHSLNLSFEIKKYRLIKAISHPLSVGVPIGILLWWIGRTFPPIGWLPLTRDILTGAGCYFVGYWISLGSKGRNHWVSFLRNILRSRTKDSIEPNSKEVRHR